MNKNEIDIDNFIRSKIARSAHENLIRPSPDFTARVMAQVSLLERRQRWIKYFLAAVLSMAPIAVRGVWLLVRGDYFSATNLPMSGLIIGAYDFFLSPLALYILVGLGILAFLLRANRVRRGYTYDSMRVV